MGDRRKLCKECFLSFETMQAIDDMRRELLSVGGWYFQCTKCWCGSRALSPPLSFPVCILSTNLPQRHPSAVFLHVCDPPHLSLHGRRCLTLGSSLTVVGAGLGVVDSLPLAWTLRTSTLGT